MLTAMTSFAVGTAFCNGAGRVLMADDAYLDLLRWDRDKVTSITRQLVTHPEDESRNHLLLDKQRRDGRPFEITKRYVRHDGEAVWVQNRVSLLHGDGRVCALVLSRPAPEESAAAATPAEVGRLAFAGVISETACTLSLQARRFTLPKTADLLAAAADAAIPEAVSL